MRVGKESRKESESGIRCIIYRIERGNDEVRCNKANYQIAAAVIDLLEFNRRQVTNLVDHDGV